LTPEAADYLRHAKLALANAQKAFSGNLFTIAAREAYIAALNAARAIVFEKLTIASKTHSGTRSLLHQLVREGLDIDRDTLDALTDGFKVKTNADYGPYEEIGSAKAEDVLRRAGALVSFINSVLAK